MLMQDSIKNALVERDLYIGEKSLKDSVIAWLSKPQNKDYINSFLKVPEYSGRFTQSSADEVLNTLSKGGDIKELIDNIFYLADREGVTALNLDTDRLIEWLTDIIDQNDIRIVFIWDEFKDYFTKNRNSLSEFQKIVELCNNKPFYFIVVTQESSTMYNSADKEWSKLKDRFVFSQIGLPDNVAFNLIDHAFKPKKAAKDIWDVLADDLNSRLDASRRAVMEAANIENVDVIKGIMPIHPMAAMILKNIAAAFESNQRSMFDFIKTANNEDVKGFQWFIENTGPLDEHPLLTVDLLWNFFYIKGRSNLTTDIQAILDTYPRQQNLRVDQQAVLKTILIMQAIDQRLGGKVDLFQVTDRNLDLAFEGIPSLEKPACGGIAKELVKEGILYRKPIGNNIEVYAAAAMAGDQTKIDTYKKALHESSTTAKLVAEGGLASVLNLTPALKLRFEAEPGTGKLHAVTMGDFTRNIHKLQDKASNTKDWRFYSVIAFAKDESEQFAFRKLIKEAAKNKDFENILFIDALSTPLGEDSFEEYIGYSAISLYYQGNENDLSKDNAAKAKRILDIDWKNRICDGHFFVYSYENQEGEKCSNGQAVLDALQIAVKVRFNHAFDFNKGLTENMLKLTQSKASAKSGLIQSSNYAVGGIEKHIIPTVWKVDAYWDHQSTLPISKIKVRIDAVINSAFAKDGQISTRELYDTLIYDFGFPPCNMSAFLAGFLLKEYAGEPYRYMDSNSGHEPMTPEKMAEMFSNYIGNSNLTKYKDSYLVKMTAEEMAFYALTEKAFKLMKNQCTSPGQAAQLVMVKMRGLCLPVWCLSEIDDYGVYDVIDKFISLVQNEGKETHKKAIEIGKLAMAKPSAAESLEILLTKENCQKGLMKFLGHFENGRLLELAKAIGADGNILEDIHKLFDVKYSGYWDKPMGENEIRKLLVEYGIVLETNGILGTNANSQKKCFDDWRERLKFMPISFEALKVHSSSLSKVINFLHKIVTGGEFLPDTLKLFYAELFSGGESIRNLLGDEATVFIKVYKPYLENFDSDDIDSIKSKLPTGMFMLSMTECNAKVNEQAEIYRKGQLKTELLTLWKEKSGALTPRKWSSYYTIPILSMVPTSEFEDAKKTFDTLNRNNPGDVEIQIAIDFIKNASFFDDLIDEGKRMVAFRREIIGEYAPILPNIKKVQEDLDRKLSIEPYEWYGNPNVKAMVRSMAEKEYNAGGSDLAVQTIDSMDDTTLKIYLKRLIQENMKVGIEIIESVGKLNAK